MGELASQSQLRMSFLRWALVTVPLILFLGFLMGFVSGSGADNRWYSALEKPSWTPPGWVFPVAWTLLYIAQGLALAMILHARGAKGRGLAIGLFAAQFLVNLLWSPTFFLAHQVTVALIIIIVMLILAGAATYVFARIRATAAYLMLPYLAWLCLAMALNFTIDLANPDAETLVPAASSTTIPLE
ncbi:MAG: TspO/MBR family protein [Sphingomonadaceae bacterium]